MLYSPDHYFLLVAIEGLKNWDALMNRQNNSCFHVSVTIGLALIGEINLLGLQRWLKNLSPDLNLHKLCLRNHLSYKRTYPHSFRVG